MFHNSSTSRIRRKVKSKFKDFRDKVQEELTVTLNDFSAVEGESFQQKIKRMMKKKSSAESSEKSSIASESSDEEDDKKSVRQRFVLQNNRFESVKDTDKEI